MKGFDVGVDDYLVKLFYFDEFVVCICLLMCCYYGCVVNCIEVGVLLLDLESVEVCFCDELVEFICCEFVLL